jgi:hypothetical protein
VLGCLGVGPVGLARQSPAVVSRGVLAHERLAVSLVHPARVGVCSEVGYVGSAWSSLSTSWAKRIHSYLQQQRFVVTRVAVAREDGKFAAEVWLPTLDPPPWQR